MATTIRPAAGRSSGVLRRITPLLIPILLSPLASAGKAIVRDLPGTESFAVRLSAGGNDGALVHVGVNPIHGLRAAFTEERVRVTPLASTADWELGLRLNGFGAAGDVRAVANPTVDSTGNRATLGRETITEWYINDERGIEHGFTLHESPGGSTLHVDLELTGNLTPSMGGGGNHVDFTPGSGFIE